MSQEKLTNSLAYKATTLVLVGSAALVGCSSGSEVAAMPSKPSITMTKPSPANQCPPGMIPSPVRAGVLLDEAEQTTLLAGGVPENLKRLKRLVDLTHTIPQRTAATVH